MQKGFRDTESKAMMPKGFRDTEQGENAEGV